MIWKALDQALWSLYIAIVIGIVAEKLYHSVTAAVLSGIAAFLFTYIHQRVRSQQ